MIVAKKEVRLTIFKKKTEIMVRGSTNRRHDLGCVCTPNSKEKGISQQKRCITKATRRLLRQMPNKREKRNMEEGPGRQEGRKQKYSTQGEVKVRKEAKRHLLVVVLSQSQSKIKTTPPFYAPLREAKADSRIALMSASLQSPDAMMNKNRYHTRPRQSTMTRAVHHMQPVIIIQSVLLVQKFGNPGWKINLEGGMIFVNLTNVFGTVVMLWIRGGYVYLFVNLMDGVRVGGRG